MKKAFAIWLCLLCFSGGFFQSLFAYELVVVSMFRNCAPYIKEWVEYHRVLGVDHFWLYDDASTDDWQSELSSYIKSGLVEVFYWPAEKPDWTGAQIAAFQDGLKRGFGVAKWIALLDQDEFILPLQDKSIPECLEKRFSHAAAVYVNWHNFGTSGITLAAHEPMLSRLIKCSSKNHPRNAVGKSIIRPECAKIDALWSQHFCSLTKGVYVNGDGNQTFTFRGDILMSNDGKNHSKYIRINHYAHRDENYFYNIRLPRDPDPRLMQEHHKAFNSEKNYGVLDHLKAYYPENYNEFWKPFRRDSRK